MPNMPSLPQFSHATRALRKPLAAWFVLLAAMFSLAFAPQAGAQSIVQAVSETVSITAGTQGSFNVRSNDTAPMSSVYNLAAGSTCSSVGISALGVASYTAAAAGQSCKLNYTVCNSGQCSTAALTVNSAAAPQLHPIRPTLITGLSSIKAVSETVSVRPGAQGSFNVRANDTAPAGAIYTLAAGSTCSPVSVTPLGVVSYTAPAAGQSCVVNYTVCNAEQCATATLTVTSGPAPVSSATPTLTVSIVQAVSETITATAGTQGTNNVRANDTAPAGSVYNLAAGSTCSPVGISALGVVSYTAPAAGTSCVVNYTVCNSGQCSTASLTVVSPSSSSTGSSGTTTTTITTSTTTATPITTTISTTSTSSTPSATTSRFSLVPKSAGGFYDVTECVKDNMTGLIWEGKTASGARAGSGLYTNLDDASQPQHLSGSAFINPTVAQINASSNSIGYKNMVNNLNLCASTAWRMPTRDELHALYVAAGGLNLSFSTTLLPNTGQSATWSSSHTGGMATQAWIVYIYGGTVGLNNRDNPGGVRLVRSSQ